MNLVYEKNCSNDNSYFWLNDLFRVSIELSNRFELSNYSNNDHSEFSNTFKLTVISYWFLPCRMVSLQLKSFDFFDFYNKI